MRQSDQQTIKALNQPVRGTLRMLAASVAMLMLGACASVGPKSVSVDRFDYSSAIAESWKQQTLLNIVKLRYLDLPVFVDVASIVAGYSMETSGSVGGQVFSSDAIQDNSLTLGAMGKYTDRPTITYVPLTGEKFLRGLITPIDPKNIFYMLQSGYAADFILGLTVESINGVRNRMATAGSLREADPAFLRALSLLREVQIAGALGMRIEESPGRGKTAIVFMRRQGVDAEVVGKLAEIGRLLKLPEGQERYVLSYSPTPGVDGELAVNSRSMLQIMAAFSSYIEVPAAHQQDGSAAPGVANDATADHAGRISIRSGSEKPSAAFAAVRYRGHWFWIDDSNWHTKRALTAVMYFFTLTDSGGNDKLPLITIPAQ